MERNIGDQLNKAFEAYRQVSIEKDHAKKELQKMTEYYEGYTHTLQKQIEDQQQLIIKLQAKLLATRQPSEMKLEPCHHPMDGAGASVLKPFPDTTGTVAVTSNLPGNSNPKYKEMQDVFEAIQGKFQQIRTLTQRQKGHLKRFHGGKDTPTDQQFSMPIQCTDRTAEAERPFPPVLRSAADVPPQPTSLASRGASPEDRDLEDSLTRLSVKFPPSADSEYDFLNSAPERHVGLGKPGHASVPSAVTEEELAALPVPFVYPPSPSHSASSSLSQENVRGPQQPLWSPELCNAVDLGAELTTPQGNSPHKCAFCHAVVPQDQMTSHLYSHCSHKNDVDN